MKVAAVQMDIKIFEKEQNLERIIANLEAAGRAGAQLAVFPSVRSLRLLFQEQRRSLARFGDGSRPSHRAHRGGSEEAQLHGCGGATRARRRPDL